LTRRVPERIFSLLCGLPRNGGAPRSSWAQTVLTSLALVSLLLLAGQAVRAAGKIEDFDVYHDAAVRVHDGETPYLHLGVLRRTYVYPPFLASALAPLTPLGRDPMYALWAALQFGALIGSLRLVARWLRSHPQAPTILALSLLFVTPFAMNAARRGQVGPLLLFLTLAAISWEGSGKIVRASAALATAMSLKLFPALIALAWLLRRRSSAIAWTAAWVVILSAGIPLLVMGPAGAADAWERYASIFLDGQSSTDAPIWFGVRGYNSQSLLSALYWWTTDASALELQDGVAPLHLVSLGAGGRAVMAVVAYSVFLGAGLVSALAARRTWGRPETIALVDAALLLGLLPILSPISLKNNFILLLPAHALLLTLWRNMPRGARMLYGLALLLHLFPFGRLLGDHVRFTLHVNSDVLLGAIALHAAVVWSLQSARSRPSVDPIAAPS
jgi:hypothetical protein